MLVEALRKRWLADLASASNNPAGKWHYGARDLFHCLPPFLAASRPLLTSFEMISKFPPTPFFYAELLLHQKFPVHDGNLQNRLLPSICLPDMNP